MKKKLYLVRHAKAESQAPMFKDFERELTGEGYIEAARMGAFLKSEGATIQRMAASSALRTKQTAQVLAEQLSFDWEHIECIDNLYDCGLRAYISAVTETSEKINELMIVGHNPDISYFAEYLTKDFYESMPKCSVCVIEFEDDLEWSHVSSRMGKFVAFFTTKNILTLGSD